MLERLESRESNVEPEYMTEMQLEIRLVSRVSTVHLLALPPAKLLEGEHANQVISKCDM